MTAADEPRRDARDRAVDALVLTYDGRALVAAQLDAWQRSAPLSDADAALARELALGVARRRITCEHVAAHFYRGRWAGLREKLRVILAVGVYQLCWLDRIPDHAAIDQAVRQSKKLGAGAAKIANAVLRQMQRHREAPVARTPEFDRRRTLLLDAERLVPFSTDVFADPERKPLAYFESAYGMPPWLVERWHRIFKPAGCLQICEASISRPGLTLRPNPLRIAAADLFARLHGRGLNPQWSSDAASILLSHEVSAGDVTEIADGLCQPQDETAQMPLRRAELEPGMFVIDYCAGVGTKSTQAAELMRNEGIVLSTDLATPKLDRLAEAARQHDINIIRPCHIQDLDAQVAAIGRSPDVILIDAPCLNTGVLARRPEARYRASRQALAEITQAQAEILQQALSLAGSATRVIYTTCSLENEENDQQVRAEVETHRDWSMVEESLTLPEGQRNGGYYTILESANS